MAVEHQSLVEMTKDEHDDIATPVKKVGNYVWNGTDWQRWDGVPLKPTNTDYTWTGDNLTQKVETFADGTVTTVYTWSSGNLVNKTITIV